MSTNLKIVKLGVDELTPYKNNAKTHPREQIEQIKASIEENGFCDPIAVWGENNIIVEGHGRLIACKELGIEKVECIRLDHLTDEQRRAYTLTHNKLTMNSGFDEDLLNIELEELQELEIEVIGFEEEPEEEHKPKEREDLSESVKEVYEIIIECADEYEQEEIYNRLSEEGLTCRVLTL
jgi:ParB-like chromosome segregation protein Spo0J